MPAIRTNYLVFYVNESQVYSTASRQIALDTPPPEGTALEDKRIVFLAWEPDNEVLSVHPLPLEEIRGAEIVPRKKKDKTSE